MPLIVRVDRVERRGSFLEGREPEQALAVGEVGTRAGMLHDRWLATGEIARRPIAHPGFLELDEKRLGAAPLARGALDVGLIRPRAVGDVARIAHPPAVALEEAPILAVAGRKVECQLERLAGHAGEREVLEEGHALVVVVAHFLAVFDQLEPLARPPAGHGGERLAARVVRVRPELQAYGRARSEEHTSELQSQSNLVCRLLLEKKKKKITDTKT